MTFLQTSVNNENRAVAVVVGEIFIRKSYTRETKRKKILRI